MNRPVIAISIFLMFASVSASAEIEYYHCEKGPDSYWRFDLNNVDKIDPHNSPSAKGSSASYANPIAYFKYDDEWFEVPHEGFIYYINRKGKESFFRWHNGVLRSLGICKRKNGDNIDKFFKFAVEEDIEEFLNN